MRPRAILGVLLLGALAVRLVAVGDTLSHDEGYTWLVASAGGPDAFLDRLSAYENTPPLYYVLTWPLPDAGVAWLRIVSVLAGVGCVAAVWWIVRALASERAALLAAGALAVAPFAVSYSDYARGFILADLGLLIALGAAVRRNWWLYWLGAAIALLAEYDSALFLVALSFAVGWRNRGDAARTLAPLAVALVWIPFAAGSDTKVAPTYPDPSPASLRDTLVRLTFGEHGTAHNANLRWLQFVLVAAVCAWAFRKAPRIIWVTAAGTLILHAITHWIGPDVFAPRYLTELIPLAAIAIGIAVAQSSRQFQVAAAVAIAALGVAVVVKRTGGNDEPDYKGVARIVESAAHHRIVLTNSAVVAYYMRDLHPRLDRPFGLGHGLQSDCLMDCGGLYLIIDDTRVAGGARIGRGHAHQFGALYVRATP
jgi:4-amino-4-deoxy-L-arabinose transferase-like glycosyltransferase